MRQLSLRGPSCTSRRRNTCRHSHPERGSEEVLKAACDGSTTSRKAVPWARAISPSKSTRNPKMQSGCVTLFRHFVTWRSSEKRFRSLRSFPSHLGVNSFFISKIFQFVNVRRIFEIPIDIFRFSQSTKLWSKCE